MVIVIELCRGRGGAVSKHSVLSTNTRQATIGKCRQFFVGPNGTLIKVYFLFCFKLQVLLQYLVLYPVRISPPQMLELLFHPFYSYTRS
jgi:hypothetical protein